MIERLMDWLLSDPPPTELEGHVDRRERWLAEYDPTMRPSELYLLWDRVR